MVLNGNKETKAATFLNGRDRENRFQARESTHQETRFTASELEQYYQASRGQNGANAAPGEAGAVGPEAGAVGPEAGGVGVEAANTNPGAPANPVWQGGATPVGTPAGPTWQSGPAQQMAASWQQGQVNAQGAPNMAGTLNMASAPNMAGVPGGMAYNAAGAAAVAAAQPKKVPRGLIVGTLIALGVLLVAGLALLMINVIGHAPAVSGTRTVMVYMLAGDLESSEGMASADLAEMQAASVGEDTHVVVYTAGAGAWQNTNIRNNAIYEVGNGSLTQRATLPSNNAATAATLSDFIEYAVNNYHSDLYDLIIWGRAGGATYGLGSDDVAIANTTLTLANITAALSENQFGSSRTLELIGFDAPLMASAETAVALSGYSNYLVASEELMPETGWNYNYLSQINRSTASADVVQAIVDQYAQGLDASDYSEQFWTLSAVDLRLMDDFLAVADPLFTDLAEELSWDNYSRFAGAVAQSTVFGYDGATSYDFVDLQSLLTAIAATDLEAASSAKEASSVLGKAIVATNGNVTAAHGLSTYFISYNKPATNAGLTRANGVSWSSGYAAFLTAYAGLASGSKQVASGGFVGSNVSLADGQLSLQLPEDLTNNFERAKVAVWQRLDSNRYVKVFESSDVTRDGNTLSASDFAYQLVATDPMSSGGLEATEIRRDEGAVYFAVPVALGGFAGNGTSSLTTQNATAIYKVISGEKTARLVDLRLPAVDGLASKGGIDLSGWSTMNFNVNAYYLLDDANNLDTPAAAHESWGTASSTMMHLDREHSVTLESLAAEGDYYAQFMVTDTQGDIHYSQLVAL